MTSAELLGKVGRALFGENWKADMAAALRMSVERVDDWSNERGDPPPHRVWLDLAAQIRDRRNVLPDLLFAVLLAADSDEGKPHVRDPKLSDDPAFSAPIRSTWDVPVPLVIKSVGEALGLIKDLPEGKKTSEHWWLARHLLCEALEHPKDQVAVKLAEAAFRSALKRSTGWTKRPDGRTVPLAKSRSEACKC